MVGLNNETLCHAQMLYGSLCQQTYCLAYLLLKTNILLLETDHCGGPQYWAEPVCGQAKITCCKNIFFGLYRSLGGTRNEIWILYEFCGFISIGKLEENYVEGPFWNIHTHVLWRKLWETNIRSISNNSDQEKS